MQSKHVALAAVMAMSLALPLGSVHAGPQQVKAQYAGSSVTGNIDTNTDGFPAGINTAVVNTNKGRFFLQGETEFLFPLETNVHCPAGVYELPLLQAHNVSTHEQTGDQRFTAYTSGWQCFDLATGNFTFHGEGDVTGGTGKFAGVTGTFVDDATGTTLIIDSAQRGLFSFSGTLTMTLDK